MQICSSDYWAAKRHQSVPIMNCMPQPGYSGTVQKHADCEMRLVQLLLGSPMVVRVEGHLLNRRNAGARDDD